MNRIQQMNRKQRRAALKQDASSRGQAAAGDPARQLFVEAEQLRRQNKLDDAARAYKRLLQLKPDHAQAANNLGLVLLALGRRAEAAAYFAQALTLVPQLFKQYTAVSETLAAVLPPMGEAMRRARAIWPTRLAVDRLFTEKDFAAVRENPLLLCMLESVPARDFGLELVLTALRSALLAAADNAGDDSALIFCCTLAKQCFIDEYVFAVTPEEDAQVERLMAALDTALSAGTTIAPMRLATLAMYRPLHAMPFADALLTVAWPPPLDAVVTQQLREPRQELALRSTMTRLTQIDDGVSLRVQQQYEENPYPRWVHLGTTIEPLTFDEQLRRKFPTAALSPLGKTEPLDILVAGCGTAMGAQIAQLYPDARVLAVDLSLSSLCYAKRKTPADLSGRVEYAQADILKLGEIGRTFDFIEVAGVLHHMADPFQGWRVLLGLLRPGGFMHLGFYSAIARADITAARAYIAQHGYVPSAADIRRVRHDLFKTPMASVSRFTDFYSMSECRDMLFHVEENCLTIPVIKEFIDGHGLRFIGFDLKDTEVQEFRAMFADAGWSMSDLAKWDTVERQFTNTFANMYLFWVQKS